MTAEEAMDRARKMGVQNAQCLMEAMRSGGSGAAIKIEVEKETKRWAAELIRAQIEAYQNAVAIADHSDNPGDDILRKQRECQDALAELEGTP